MNYKFLLAAIACFFLESQIYAQTQTEMLQEYNQHIKNEKFEKADKLADEMLSKFPDQAILYLRKAESLGMIDQWPKAFQLLDYAIDQFPDSIFLYVSTANVYVSFKRPDQAIPYFDAGLAHCVTAQDSLDLLTFRGGVHSKRRAFDLAEKDLKDALSIDPKSIDALNNLAAIYDEMGDTNESIDILIQIVEIDSLYLPGIINLGFMLQNVDKDEKALIYFDKAVKLAPDAPLAYSNRSYSRMKTGDLKGAMSDIDKSLELFETNSWAYKIKGLIYLEKKKFDKACEQFYLAKQLRYTEEYGSEVDELIEGFCID